jgi:hypothetical protein
LRYLHLFESFISNLYEIRLTHAHYQERTSTIDIASRIVPRSIEYPAGWRIIKYVTDTNREIGEFKPAIKVPEDLLAKYITAALGALTSNQRLKDWKNPKNPLIDQLNLGRIAIWDGESKFYPYLSGGEDPKLDREFPGEFRGGDVIWLSADQDLAKTIKYYPNTREGEDSMWNAARLVSGFNKNEFKEASDISFPYGKDFEVIIDLTDDDTNNVIKKIKDKVLGKEIVLGRVRKEDIIIQGPEYLSPDYKRITIVKGLILGIKKAGETTTNIFEIAEDPKNALDLYEVWKEDRENGTSKLRTEPVICSAYKTKQIDKYMGVNKMTTYSRTSSFADKIKISKGDIIFVKKIPKGDQMEPDTPYSFKWVTSEQAILAKGKVQIAIDLVRP